jgi:hypothetical protein
MMGDAMQIRLEGVFDVNAARRLARDLEAMPPAEHVDIEFGGVTLWHDCAVAILAKLLAERGEVVELRGLGRHHLRLLRYLGSGAARDPQRGSDE